MFIPYDVQAMRASERPASDAKRSSSMTIADLADVAEYDVLSVKPGRRRRAQEKLL